VLRGFEIADLLLIAQRIAPASFGVIGPGSGSESIGAAQIFHSLTGLVATDRDPLLMAEASINIRRHVDAAIEVVIDEGHIYAPLVTTGRRVDLLYANLADIPFTVAPDAVVEHLSFCPAVSHTPHDALLNRYQLGLAYCFLRSAAVALTRRGSALVLLGARFPLAVFDRLAESVEMRFVEIRCWLQRQTDVCNVIAGFAAAETRATAFDFYDFDAAQTVLAGVTSQPLADELKLLLAPFRLSASEALTASRTGCAIGYMAHLIMATPFRDQPTGGPNE